ncbi:MAG: acyl CoA:acetate/3-ketoacid CoA transferase beta subunit [Saprospiraceae bacterium]
MVKEKVENLKNSIPEIQRVDVGINIGQYGASFFDVGMYITFNNESDFLNYIKYESHDKAVTFIQSVMEAEEIVDFV